MLGIVLGRQWQKRQIVPALMKACSSMGNVVWVGMGAGRQKGLTRIYNIVCDYTSVRISSALCHDVGGINRVLQVSQGHVTESGLSEK